VVAIDEPGAKKVQALATETAESPRSFGRPLRGEGLWQYRVGDCRVLCQIRDDHRVVLVIEVGHRRDVHR
jgi:mRNA interferase RelE/StbE